MFEGAAIRSPGCNTLMIRLVLAALIGLGLVLAPIAGAMPGALTHVNHSTAVAMSSTDGDCLCCQTATQCTMRTCVTHCSQLGPALDLASNLALVGRTALSGFEPSTYYGLTYQPPTPPPRA